MTTWTNKDYSDGPVDDQDLLIEGAFQLLIGDGFSLLIQEQSSGPAWTERSKQSDAVMTNTARRADATFTNVAKS